MPRIRFTRHYTVKDDTKKTYKAGDVVEVSDASAKHFTDRNAAEIVKDDEPKRPELPKQTPAPKAAAEK